MSTHKHFDVICCVVLCLTLILTALFMNADKLGVQKASTVMGYEEKLFDTSKVHSINIIMDNWDDFIADCQNEEYYSCTVVIDNEAYKNVAIRGKGNTSLTQVASYGNNRYSFKIEFDHYDSSKNYHGLDKLCLNNIIQDNTYMKDYLSYTMMNYMGVASPLCSYAYITVNGEDWGLYLAVEGVEESFLQRNYGKDYGELYKPDSQSMGGGRGNGEKFDMNEFTNNSDSDSTASDKQNNPQNNNGSPPQMPEGETADENFSGSPTGNGTQPPELPNNGGNTGSGSNANGTPPEKPGTQSGSDGSANSENGATPPDNNGNGAPSKKPDGNGGSDMMNSSDDVLLKYIDDEIDSYSNIFDNAKTDVSDSDKERLIESLKKLSDGEDISDTVDIEKVLRYFVVHNFVLNFDSYTGSMIHNYYLYEKNGQMQMIPWDYNLAFGGFQSMGSATSLVNYPIDTPVSGGSIGDRPMLAWIFSSEEYTELYHKYFSEFISEYFDSGYFEETIDDVKAMISPYVEKDPTKFCTYDEFEKGIDTLKQFCLLRAESVTAQLDGTIGSTSDTQADGTLISADSIQISDMGSMNNGGESFNNDMPKMKDETNTDPFSESTKENGSDASEETSQPPNSNGEPPDMKANANNSDLESNTENKADTTASDTDKQALKDKETANKSGNQAPNQSSPSKSDIITLTACFVFLILAIIFVLLFKRRKR